MIIGLLPVHSWNNGHFLTYSINWIFLIILIKILGTFNSSTITIISWTLARIISWPVLLFLFINHLLNSIVQFFAYLLLFTCCCYCIFPWMKHFLFISRTLERIYSRRRHHHVTMFFKIKTRWLNLSWWSLVCLS